MDEDEQLFFEGGIELDEDNLTIDGQNHVIDANNLSRIFYITGKNITLKNIIFKNGMFYKTAVSSEFDGGGAICVTHDASVRIENCEFTDNQSMSSAGAIKDYGGILGITGSTFKNNTAERYGGVLLNQNRDLSISNCTFEKNFSKLSGGVFYSNVYVLAKLANDDYTETKRGDYENYYNLYLEDCSFRDNSSRHNGGAIYGVFINLDCTKCCFENNNIGEYDKMQDSIDYSGGAIAVSTGEHKFTKCTFTANNSKNMGGAIYFNDGVGYLDDCLFYQNYSRMGGQSMVDMENWKTAASKKTVLNTSSTATYSRQKGY